MRITIDGSHCIGYVEPARNTEGFPTGSIIAKARMNPVELPEHVWVELYGPDEDGEPTVVRGMYRIDADGKGGDA